MVGAHGKDGNAERELSLGWNECILGLKQTVNEGSQPPRAGQILRTYSTERFVVSDVPS